MPNITKARLEKLERAVKAAIWLRKQFEDISEATRMLSVPREAVDRFDQVMKELTLP